MSEEFGEELTESCCLMASAFSQGCDVVITAHGHVFSITDSKQVQECFMNKGLKVKSKKAHSYPILCSPLVLQRG